MIETRILFAMLFDCRNVCVCACTAHAELCRRQSRCTVSWDSIEFHGANIEAYLFPRLLLVLRHHAI